MLLSVQEMLMVVGFGPFTTALQDEVLSSAVHMDADNGQEPYVEA
jgi:hypothetical protein